MARIRTNNVFGTTTDNPLTAGATTMNSAGLANLAVIASPNVAVITLDPNRVNGAPEIVHVTAHTGSATSATIVRGREGTVDREHPLGTFWVHAPSASDFGGTLGYAQVTANQGSITTVVDLTGLTVTVTVDTDQRIKVTGSTLVQSTAGDTSTRLQIQESTTVLQTRDVNHATAAVPATLDAVVVLTPTAGSHTYKLTMQEVAGAGTTTMLAAATFPAFILVEDIGAI